MDKGMYQWKKTMIAAIAYLCARLVYMSNVDRVACLSGPMCDDKLLDSLTKHY